MTCARGSVRSWVLGIVHNRAIDALRRTLVHERRRASDEGLDRTVASVERTDAEAISNEDARFVRAALDALPPDQRRVVELAYFSGYTHTEIAEAIDVAARHREGAHAPRAAASCDDELDREGVAP